MKKILLYNSGGGLGDSIQLFDLIISSQVLYYISASQLEKRIKSFMPFEFQK